MFQEFGAFSLKRTIANSSVCQTVFADASAWFRACGFAALISEKRNKETKMPQVIEIRRCLSIAEAFGLKRLDSRTKRVYDNQAVLREIAN